MSLALKLLLSQSLRLVLAAVLLLAGVASARLQSDARIDYAALCLTSTEQHGDIPEGTAPSHQHCLICGLHFLDVPGVIKTTLRFSFQEGPGNNDLSAFATALDAGLPFARGPPLAG